MVCVMVTITNSYLKCVLLCDIPLIASGGAGTMQDFVDVFKQSHVDGALAASVFHKNVINIGELKQYLTDNQVAARLCN